MGVGLVVGVWIARYLGPTDFGQLSYALAFVILFSSLANLGLDGIAIRNIVRDPSAKDDILGTVFTLKLIGGITTSVIIFIAIRLLHPADNITHWLVGIAAAGLIFQAFDTIDYWFQSQVQSKYTVVSRSTAFLIISLIKIIMIIFQAPLIAFAWAGLAEIAFGYAGLIIAYRSIGNQISTWKFRKSIAYKLLNDSWPLVFSSMLYTIYMRIDQVMLRQMSGNEELGIYSAAVRLSEVWNFIPIAIVSSVYPSIVEAKALNDELFYSRLQRLYNFLSLVGYVIAVPTTFLAGWLVTALFGSAYERAGTMLVILIWSGLFLNVGYARGSFLITMNWTKTNLMTFFIGCSINIALNILLIPQYGGVGASLATCIAIWFTMHGVCFFYKPLFNTGLMITKALLYPKVW